MTTPSVSEYPPLVELGRTLAFFTSVIKSGEPWTATCQRDYDRANLALQALAHLPAGSEAVKPLEPVAYHVTKPGEINDYLSFFHLSAGDIADGYQERALVYAAPPSTPPAANVQEVEAAYQRGLTDGRAAEATLSYFDARSKQAPTVEPQFLYTEDGEFNGNSPENEAEHFIQAAIDSAPEPLRRLGEWLANKLDDDDWKTADKLITGAAVSLVACSQQTPTVAVQVALEWAVEALQHSEPKASHYPEPVERHKQALDHCKNAIEHLSGHSNQAIDEENRS